MDFRKKIRLGDLLVEAGSITQEQLMSALEKQKKTGMKLGVTLVDEGVITEDDIAEALGRQLGIEIVDLQNINVDKAVTQLVPVNILKKYTMIPFAFSEKNKNVLRVAMENPLDTYAQEDISIITNYQVEPVVATTRSIMLAIDKYHGQNEMKTALSRYAKEKRLEVEVDEQEQEDISSSPIVKLVKEMIDLAVRQRASDIHIEPMEEYIRVRYRIDGVLQKKATYNVSVLPAIIARIKIIGGMDISEKRKPQDGRITQVVDHVEYDIRVSILPTVFGEKVVMRLTAKMALTREKSQLGLKPYELEQFDYIIRDRKSVV